MERDLLSVLSIYRRIFLRVFFMCRLLLEILFELYSATLRLKITKNRTSKRFQNNFTTTSYLLVILGRKDFSYLLTVVSDVG